MTLVASQEMGAGEVLTGDPIPLTVKPYAAFLLLIPWALLALYARRAMSSVPDAWMALAPPAAFHGALILAEAGLLPGAGMLYRPLHWGAILSMGLAAVCLQLDELGRTAWKQSREKAIHALLLTIVVAVLFVAGRFHPAYWIGYGFAALSVLWVFYGVAHFARHDFSVGKYCLIVCAVGVLAAFILGTVGALFSESLSGASLDSGGRLPLALQDGVVCMSLSLILVLSFLVTIFRDDTWRRHFYILMNIRDEGAAEPPPVPSEH